MRRDPFPIDLIVSNRIAVAGTAIADILHLGERRDDGLAVAPTDPPENTERLVIRFVLLYSNHIK